MRIEAAELQSRTSTLHIKLEDGREFYVPVSLILVGVQIQSFTPDGTPVFSGGIAPVIGTAVPAVVPQFVDPISPEELQRIAEIKKKRG